MGPRGTANLAVLGGNLSPSFGTRTTHRRVRARRTRRGRMVAVPPQAFACIVPAKDM